MLCKLSLIFTVLHKYGCLLGVWKCNINPYGGLVHIKVRLSFSLPFKKMDHRNGRLLLLNTDLVLASKQMIRQVCRCWKMKTKCYEKWEWLQSCHQLMRCQWSTCMSARWCWVSLLLGLLVLLAMVILIKLHPAVEWTKVSSTQSQGWYLCY